MPAPQTALPLNVAKAALFKSLGHPARVRILELLVEGEQSVSNLLVATGLEPSSLSQHLNVLKSTGLVQSRREGNGVTYEVTDPSVAVFLAAARSVLATTLGRAREALEELEGPEVTVSARRSAGQPAPRRTPTRRR